MTPVVLSLGGNVGDVRATLAAAIERLGQVPGFEVCAVSSLYRTPPWGGVAQDDFLNAVVLGETSLDPLTLLRACQAIEDALGRRRDVRWGPRTLDIDLIVVGDEARATDELTLPHPYAHERAFVLVPWLEVDGDAVLPGRGAVVELLRGLDAVPVRRVTAEEASQEACDD